MMSLTWKLLTATALLSSTLMSATNTEVEDFLKESLGKNPNIKSLNIKVLEKREMPSPKGWDAFILSLDAVVKQGKSERPVSQNMIYFAKDDIITAELIDMSTGEHLKNTITPAFKAEFYDKKHLISGSATSKHKVVIFSDPQCPYCTKFVPESVNYMKKYPETFAVYYYHFPLVSMHPAALQITKAAIAAELKGEKDITLKMYKTKIGTREKDEQKIVDAFNKAAGTKITVKDIHTKEVKAHSKHDLEVARTMMVSGTPTMFFDGKKDGSKKKYREVKVK
ncbi:MAG: thioredoxin domain-containing protein [Campylobacterota bacterium]|nr:thioredoxin domain-containing protein [Campylobacterota bacterium]